MNDELPDVQAVFRKGGGTRDQIDNICLIKKAREFQKIIYFCFIDYAKICLLRNWYTGYEETVITRPKQQTDSKQEKQYVQAVYCHTTYLTYVQNTSLEKLG